MKQRRVAFHLIWMGLLVVMAAGIAATIASTPGAAPEQALLSASDAGPGDAPAAEDATPVACRMEPQCSTNSDCVVWCGLSGGHCVHSSCPTRICKCN
jgi:hypothetical protein